MNLEVGFQSLEGIINLLIISSFLSGFFGIIILMLNDKKNNKKREFFLYILFFILFSLIPLTVSGIVCGLTILTLN